MRPHLDSRARGDAAESPRTASARGPCSRLPPRQWLKNVLVLAAPGAAGVLTRPEIAGRLARRVRRASARFRARPTCSTISTTGTRTGCIRDGATAPDRQPAGSRRALRRRGGRCLLACSGLALACGRPPVARGRRRRLPGADRAATRSGGGASPIADIAAISCGFVLRALAGGVATDVAVSRWFMLVTSFGALFLVTGKRYAELRSERERRDGARLPARILRALPDVRDRARRRRSRRPPTVCGRSSALIRRACPGTS